MQFYSTNHFLERGLKEKVDFSTALLTGQAPDGGLFIPEYIPLLSQKQILSLRHRPYYEVASAVLDLFLADNLSKEKLLALLKDAYTFDIPLENPSENLYLARMDAGPTASFKDFAAQFLARIFSALKPESQSISILVATSGDTGSAIGEAFKNIKGIRVFILYPRNEVSTIQRKQLTTLGENVTAIELEGKFDDCQDFVKKAFEDRDLNHLHLSSANSINIGRLLPQIVYYFYLYLKVAKNNEPVNFCIPTGNLGNAMGCIIAKLMGLPIHKIIIASNANDSIANWLKTGTYKKTDPSINTISNAMNVGNPSNLARLFEFFGGSVDRSGKTYQSPDLQKLKEILEAITISDQETIACIKQVWHDKKILLEPHGAVGWTAIEKYRIQNPQDKCDTILLETAHPAKFPEIIEKELGFSPEIPEGLKNVMEKEEIKIKIPNEYQEFKKVLLGFGS